MTQPPAIAHDIRRWAGELGFDQCGIAPAITSEGFHHLVSWIDAGYAAQMHYFADRLDAYRHPRGVLDGAQSIVVLSMPYPSDPAQRLSQGQGKVARYAWPGDDYHDLIHPKLKQLCRRIVERFPDAKARGVVDTAPLLEREVAQLAGLGWRGKNTLLINRDRGSYFFVACVLVDVELPYDTAHLTDHCGTCTACLDACPTDAFPDAGILDASRCISYLTIENRDAIEPELRPMIGDWVFGCDVCQEVCPWNKKHGRPSPQPQSPLRSIALAELFALSDEDFRTRYRRTPLWRTRRRGILRNAAIVLGNQADRSSTEPLVGGLHDQEPLVRQAAAWALGQIGGQPALSALRCRRDTEAIPTVIEEIDQAIANVLRR